MMKRRSFFSRIAAALVASRLPLPAPVAAVTPVPVLPPSVPVWPALTGFMALEAAEKAGDVISVRIMSLGKYGSVGGAVVQLEVEEPIDVGDWVAAGAFGRAVRAKQSPFTIDDDAEDETEDW
jgi:hypothetical protein